MIARTRLRVAAVPVAMLAVAVPTFAEPPASAAVEVTTLVESYDGAVGGVAVDRLGTLYVADFGENVWKVSPHGERTLLSGSMYGASGNAVDGRGDLYQANFFADSISRIARDGSVSVVAAGLAGPVGVAVVDEAALIVCNCRSNSLARVSLPDGAVTTYAESELFRCPNGIVRGDDDELYVVNFSDGQVLLVDGEGSVRSLATVPGGGNGHVARVGDELFVTGFRSNVVWRVGPDGSVAPFAGSGRFAAEDGTATAAGFASPNGIAYDPRIDVLYTNDFLVPFPQRNLVPSRSAVRRIAFPTLTARVLAALDAGGIDAARAEYRGYKATRTTRFTELETNALGYRLLQERKLAEAIAVFELNAESYPRSWNVHDSLGEAYRIAGKRAKAIESYRRSLELNPASTSAAEALAELVSR